MCVIDPLLNPDLWQEIGDVDETYIALQLQLGQCISGLKYSELAARQAIDEYKCQLYLHKRFPYAEIPPTRKVRDVSGILRHNQMVSI